MKGNMSLVVSRYRQMDANGTIYIYIYIVVFCWSMNLFVCFQLPSMMSHGFGGTISKIC